MTATAQRDLALEKVARKKWMASALTWFDRVTLPNKFTGEDIRLAMQYIGCPDPHHHNAWGAFTMQLVRTGRIYPTEMFTSMKTAKSHARMTRLYVMRIIGGYQQ